MLLSLEVTKIFQSGSDPGAGSPHTPSNKMTGKMRPVFG
jgi:hypothetical protein